MENAEARKRFDQEFVRAHRHVFRYIAALAPNWADAEEIFQDTCLKILEKWQDYDPCRPMVPWACGIAQNMLRKFFERSRRRGVPLSETVLTAISETQHRLSSEIDRRLQELPDCLQKLTAEQRLLLDRCYGRQDSIQAVAEESHLDPSTVYKQLKKIRRTLFDCIESAVKTE
jgi:RNA polymerase sigma-70 factor (ECF subfamily)